MLEIYFLKKFLKGNWSHNNLQSKDIALQYFFSGQWKRSNMEKEWYYFTATFRQECTCTADYKDSVLHSFFSPFIVHKLFMEYTVQLESIHVQCCLLFSIQLLLPRQKDAIFSSFPIGAIFHFFLKQITFS